MVGGKINWPGQHAPTPATKLRTIATKKTAVSDLNYVYN